MESAIVGAKWILDRVLSLFADDLVAGYVASRELGLNFDINKRELLTTQALLHEAQEMGVSNNNDGLQGLLQELRKKGDEAEDVLDELHYFRIRDKLDDTNKFDPCVPDDLRGQVVHGRHALRHTVSNFIPSWFSSSSKQDDADGVDDVINNPKRAKYGDCHDVDHRDRVAMSNKIKSVIEDIRSLCQPISSLLTINAGRNPVGSRSVTVGKDRDTGSIPQTTKLYGRDVILEKTISDMTSGTIHHETLSVLPIFGIGGIGKTTLAQHLYNHEKIEQHFTIRAWVCVSTNFNVLKLTKDILECIEDSNGAHESNNLDQLQQSIVKILKSKRFLIVFDDIWECSLSKWEQLLAPLKKSESDKGSMVLVTTRNRSIAEDVKTNNNPVHLEGSEPSVIMKWFQEYVFDPVPAGSSDHGCMTEIARQIAAKLKGSPLAATTVGRLLKRNFSQEHWNGILERQEWLDENNADGILPALKISYNYLPLHLKKYFLYFGLFPEDYRFHNLNITQFWDAIGIISSNDKPEVTGSKYLKEFVNHGFLVKEGDKSNSSYVMHDLLHELSQRVSCHECANISGTSFRADNIPPSIQHLSITIEKSDGNFEEEMSRLMGRVDIGHLRTLMIFGNTSASIDSILGNALREIKRLRVLSIILRSDDESWSQNFSKLMHLRFLRISYLDRNRFYINRSPTPISLPTTISTLYHLKFLEINSQNFGANNLPRNFSRLVSLRHVVGHGEILHNVPEVGEMKYLQELKIFHVKKGSAGFELDQLGKLKELGGQLCIRGLEKVETMEEARKADLRQKKNLRKLILMWPIYFIYLDMADNVIDGFEPHPNLRELRIFHHPGVVGPKWLCHRDMCITSLESLSLFSISWNVLPPFGLLPRLKELELREISGMSQFGQDFGGVTKNNFASLKTIKFVRMPDLVKWVGGAVSYHFFSRLERILCSKCPKLSVLPFSECTNPTIQETNTVWFPNLCSLSIDECPELSLPPLPHTSMLTDIWVSNSVTNSELVYEKPFLRITKYSGDLVFDNLDKAEEIKIQDAPQISLTDLRKLCSLRDLSIVEREIDFWFSGDPSDNLVLPSVQKLRVETFHSITKLLPRVLKFFPNFAELNMIFSNEGAEHEEQVLPAFPSYSSLRKVIIERCKNLVLPLEDGGGFGGLVSLESLTILKCGNIFSRWSTGVVSDRSINPFPAALRELEIWEEPSMRSMDLIRNLTSLTCLRLTRCDNLTLDGFNPQITLNLKILHIYNTGENCSVAADIFTEVARSNPLAMGFFHHLEHLYVDSIAAVLVDPICKLLSAKLVYLRFWNDDGIGSFTEEQEKALQQLARLEVLEFKCCQNLRCLPEGLHGLRSLKRTSIFECPNIRSLPQNGFPASLERLAIWRCKELLEEAYKLDRGRYPNLVISN